MPVGVARGSARIIHTVPPSGVSNVTSFDIAWARLESRLNLAEDSLIDDTCLMTFDQDVGTNGESC